MRSLPDKLCRPGWRAERRRNEPWFFWVWFNKLGRDAPFADIPGVGYDGHLKAWCVPEEVLAMVLLKDEEP